MSNHMQFGGQGALPLYLNRLQGGVVDPAAAAFYAALDHIRLTSPSVAESIVREFRDQRRNLKLIASENFSSLAVQLTQGNLFTDKYAEGFAHHRFYAGCDNVDNVEAEAAQLACDLFGAEHAYVQPHSGSDANLAAYIAILSQKIQEPLVKELGEDENFSKVSADAWVKVRQAFHGQKLLALDYYSGGHLTHGYRFNYSSLLFDSYSYSVNPNTYRIEMDDLRKQLHEIKPLILLAGYSAYPRKINFAKMRELADEVGAVFMVDMAHFAGLVAGKVFTGEYDPIPYAHVVTSTTHKTLRGPRGGIVLCKKEYADWVDKGCPSFMGGPLSHAMAAKAVAFKEALKPEFKAYAHKIVENCQTLASECMKEGMKVVTDGTDNHLMLLDVSESFGLTGRQAESAVRECNMTLNRNAIPFDVNGPWYTSGLRLGTAAPTSLGMGTEEMKEIARIVKTVLKDTIPEVVSKGKNKGQLSKGNYVIADAAKQEAQDRIQALLTKFPLYGNLDLGLLKEAGFIAE